MTSQSPTPWATICKKHGQVFMTREEYDLAMRNADRPWFCAKEGCNLLCDFDDDNYEDCDGIQSRRSLQTLVERIEDGTITPESLLDSVRDTDDN